MPKIILDGQEINLSPDQCATDEILINTLLPYYPAIGTAEIQREDDLIRIVKTAGTKGNQKRKAEKMSSFCEEILQQFQQVNQTINPALELTWQLRFSELQNQLKIEDLLNLQPQISQAITQGEDTFAQIEEILKKLTQAPAVASRQSMFI